ncbi:MAG: hypothetical protein LBR23_03720 [Spirochaetaceae bacterium]|nr:hypothetical protein [Spirochaetaceae bacterium]
MGAEKVVVGLATGRTPVCCNGGKAQGYYTPGVLLAKPGAQWDEPHREFTSNGVNVLVSDEALAAADGDISVTMERALIFKKLTVSGFPKRVYDGDLAERIAKYDAKEAAAMNTAEAPA